MWHTKRHRLKSQRPGNKFSLFGQLIVKVMGDTALSQEIVSAAVWL